MVARNLAAFQGCDVHIASNGASGDAAELIALKLKAIAKAAHKIDETIDFVTHSNTIKLEREQPNNDEIYMSVLKANVGDNMALICAGTALQERFDRLKNEWPSFLLVFVESLPTREDIDIYLVEPAKALDNNNVSTDAVMVGVLCNEDKAGVDTIYLLSKLSEESDKFCVKALLLQRQNRWRNHVDVIDAAP